MRPTPEFTALVTSLRDRYFQAIADREQAGEDLDIGERLERDFAAEHQALPLGAEYFLEYYLHPDGRLIVYTTVTEEVEAERRDPWGLAHGLRIGSKRYPELESLLPPRPAGATSCAACHGTGRVTKGDDWQACWQCNGLGWHPAGLEPVVERAAADARAAGDNREAMTALARRFLAEGSAVLGSPDPVATYFDAALRRAGFAIDRRAEYADLFEAVAKEQASNGPR